MSIKNNQSGFTAVEALLILIVVGILGFTSWFVYHSKQTADKTYNSQPLTHRSTTKTSTETNTNDLTKLSISQWQLSGTVPADLAGVNYSLSTDGARVTFSSGLQNKLIIGSVYCSNTNSPWGVVRTTEKPEANSLNNTRQIGSYWYQLDMPQGGCDQSVSDAIAKRINDAYLTLFTSLVAQ